MEDLRRLVEDNSKKLDQVAKRSRTLRQAHPRINVPASVFDKSANPEGWADAQSILSSTEFTFDQEIINSKAYRRAIALATLRAEAKEPMNEVEDGDLIDLNSPTEETDGETQDSATIVAEPTSPDKLLESQQPENMIAAEKETEYGEHDDFLDALESSMLPFMPPMPSAPKPMMTPRPTMEVAVPESSSTPPPALSSLVDSLLAEEPSSLLTANVIGETTNATEDVPRPAPLRIEKPPPLPRRPVPSRSLQSDDSLQDRGSGSPLDDDDSTLSEPSVFSKVSSASSQTQTDAPSDDRQIRRRIGRKPLPLSRRTSANLLGQMTPSEESLTLATPTDSSEMKAIWMSLLTEEEKLVERMTKFRKIFCIAVVAEWPSLAQHLEATAIFDKLAPLHEQHMLKPMRSHLSRGDCTLCAETIFETWATRTHALYREYAQRMPHSESSLRLTQNMDQRFTPFTNTLGLSIVWFGKGWQDYIKLPMLQLDVYVETLQKLLGVVRNPLAAMTDTHETSLQRTLDTVQTFRKGCLDLLEEAKRREDISGLCRRIKTTDSESLAQLNLSDSGRRIIFQGGLSIRVTGQGPWQSIHAVLLDNYLLWGKVKAPKTSIWKPQERKGDSIWILENPIAISELEVTLPESQDRFKRTTYRDEITKGLTLYEIFVKNKMSAFKAHTLGAFSPGERSEWHAHLISAIKGLPITNLAS
jgi:hypothetical protein